ncbi:hypothetical protein KKF61_04680 [Patescibacteria group bacterium]|nr:hypothetical protein [Patescibacteria group bacterium]MBU0964172.1 hypothetical protein [Patescibacteria group bacterium]
MKELSFPGDELIHNHSIEWWYWNGHLQDRQGRKYSYMNCLFHAKLKEVQFPFIRSVPVDKIFFSHSLLSDISRKKFIAHVDFINLMSRDSFRRPLLFINYANPILVDGFLNKVMERTDQQTYHIKNENVDLQLVSTKKPLLTGGQGYVRLMPGRSSFYYSLTNLRTSGFITVKNNRIPVTGQSWMDHQWANVKYIKDRWTWFSVQLENNIELVCYEYGHSSNTVKQASIILQNGRQFHTKDIHISSGNNKWTSPKTKAEYPLEWFVEIPEYKIKIRLCANLSRQEMVYGTINYWEGSLTVSGNMGNKRVTGHAFAELVGYPAEISNYKFIKSSITDIIRKGWDIVKRR